MVTAGPKIRLYGPPKLVATCPRQAENYSLSIYVLAQLAEHWWDADEYPFPAKDRIAQRLNKSPRQVQRYITQLEKAGHIARIKRFSGRKAQISNGYSFDGLIKKLKALEPQFSKEADQRRIRRKRFERANTS